ncbi:AI-2E family transporter [Brucella pituitosa]|uniref:AI-2E family transporter n=1 Tax=Brucella TaxID=234 RepID=UPI0001C87322|nr:MULTISPECIES: AI-2E family transporter [Brucella]PQZ46954.1 AI-2E family transporter [Ochrobactrum sp. MYb19]PRA54008.1 AI-2E family transporter [Ochrobactrum sp. MYb68]PRA61330.1 AI-2E family transporter [Ochrobactrum sp. MYb18]PRA76441.1 AI-2E family transporter [Brucella thiophenivorans]PRA87008.1 AI-2E family transporter [Ochrobactrum sp. MYb29]PRA91539.1 AI-2E family transporter [Ochrobactrum sp. MYb14]PRA98448.1 AI-2E family transporter [Ochrobactrum sp. MYb15]
MVKKPAPVRDTTSKTIQQSEAVARDGDIHVNVEVGGFTGSVIRRQAMFWTCAVAVFILFLVIFSPVLLPFVAGMALAYFLDPVADRLERLGLSRLASTIVILLVFLMILVIGLMIIIPILATQLADFISKLPDYISQLQALMTNENSQWLKRYIGIDSSVIQENLSTLLQQGAGFLSTLLQSLWNSGKSLIDIAGLFIVTPVVAFYMLLDWDRMVDRIDSWVPRRQLYTVRGIARDMDAAVAGFVRGQGTLCLILGTYYAIGLTLTGLNFGLLIGFFAGLISFIPYIGSFVGLTLAIGVALVQFWPDWIMIVAVAAVFFLGQFVEGNILQPKLVGSSVGLHPVWLMFALFAFGSLFGFTGMLVAVPAAAAVGVLVRFALNRYLHSPMYDPVYKRPHSDAGPLIEAGENTGKEK